MTDDVTVEGIDQSLKFPSFEDELALSDIPRKLSESAPRGARLETCKVCGAQVWVGPYDIFRCSKGHDPEDDDAVEVDSADEEYNEDNL